MHAAAQSAFLSDIIINIGSLQSGKLMASMDGVRVGKCTWCGMHSSSYCGGERVQRDKRPGTPTSIRRCRGS